MISSPTVFCKFLFETTVENALELREFDLFMDTPFVETPFGPARYWPQQYIGHSKRHSQKRRMFCKNPLLKNALSWFLSRVQNRLT